MMKYRNWRWWAFLICSCGLIVVSSMVFGFVLDVALGFFLLGCLFAHVEIRFWGGD